MNTIFSAVKAIIINNKNELLIVKQQIGAQEIWDLPGGRIEYGETPIEALKREVLEEVNLEVTLEKIAGIWWFFRTDKAQVICTTWLCKPTYFDVDINKNPALENITNYEWVTKESFLNENYYVSHESLKQLVSQVL